jgi:hypothetical protein
MVLGDDKDGYSAVKDSHGAREEDEVSADAVARSSRAVGYSKLGEHVASVLEAAELAAERVTEEARSEVAALREQSQREAAELIGAANREAEAMLRTAELESSQRVQEVQERHRVVEENLAATEQRLQQLATGLRELASSLDGLVDAHPVGVTLEESLKRSVADHRAASESSDVAS